MSPPTWYSNDYEAARIYQNIPKKRDDDDDTISIDWSDDDKTQTQMNQNRNSNWNGNVNANLNNIDRIVDDQVSKSIQAASLASNMAMQNRNGYRMMDSVTPSTTKDSSSNMKDTQTQTFGVGPYGPDYPYPPPYDPYGPPPYPQKHSNNGLSLGLGLGIGIPLFLALVACFCFLIFRWHRNKKAGLTTSAFPPLPMPKTMTMNAYAKHDNSPPIPNFDPWEISRTNLMVNYDKKLGSGAFCNVFKGKIIGDAPVSRVYPGVRTAALRDCDVAVKMLPSFADDIARSDFMQEINFMKSLAYHPHLVSMVGFVSDRKSPLLLVEYCEKQDLLHLIREKKQEIIEGPLHPDGMKIKDLLSFSWQISNGLEYLNSVGCIHRDVAARNVLVDGSTQCKIGDFGLCRLTDTLLYTARGGRLPLKWMSPESLSTYEYSFKSDVWSYGVLLWELFSLGNVPFAGVQTTELLEYLEDGHRLDQPECCPDEVFDVISTCWQLEARNRPTFNAICKRLAGLLEMATESYGYLIPIKQHNIHIDNV